MIFGPVPVADALGAVLAHSLRHGALHLRKGTELGAAEVAALQASGLSEVIVARPEVGDVPEDEAALRLARALCGEGLTLQDPFTGRCNLRAMGGGVLRIDRAAINAINAVDPAITVATLPEWQRVSEGMMAATVKIIPYAVSGASLDEAARLAQGALSVRGSVCREAQLIVTTLPGASSKSQPVLERLARLGVSCHEVHVPHAVDAIAEALEQSTAPLRLILTASATSDAADVGPSAVLQAGGELIRMGMPVDPGNLLFLARLGDADVIGLPGCARSPALNGADWVMERLICGVPVTGADIAAMGVGGLLGEIPTRPQPRDKSRKPNGGPLE